MEHKSVSSARLANMHGNVRMDFAVVHVCLHLERNRFWHLDPQITVRRFRADKAKLRIAKADRDSAVPCRAAYFGAINVDVSRTMLVLMKGSLQTRPAGTFVGQRTRQGTRTPPSKLVSFPSRKGVAEPACSP